MSKKITVAVPELRFANFKEDWKKEKIGQNSIKVGSGSTPKGGEKVYTDKGVPFIRSQNVIDNRLIMDDISFIPLSIDEKMKGSRVKALDILLNITGGSLG